MPLSFQTNDPFDEAIAFVERRQLAEPGALGVRDLPEVPAGDEFDEAIASLSSRPGPQEGITPRRQPIPETEHGFLGEIAAGLGRGALRVAATPAYIADVAGEALGWEGLEKTGERGAEKVEKFIEERPGLRKSTSISGDIRSNPQLWKDPNWYASIVSEGIPTVFSMLIPGVGAARGAQALGWGIKGIKAARVAGGLSAAMGLEAGGAAEQARQYEKATGKEIPVGKKLHAVIGTGVVAGALEYAPIFRIFGKGAGRKLVRRVLEAMATEGSTEGAQEIVANHFAKAGYDVDKDMAEGIIESIVGGVLIGGGMGGIAGPARTMQDQLDASTTPENVERISRVIEEGENEALLDRFRKGTAEDLVSLRQSPEGAEYAKELDQVIGEKGVAEEKGLIPREEMGPRALPPGQGFGLLTEEEAQARRGIPYSPELAEGLRKPEALPPGQGFDLLPPKPKTRLRKALPTEKFKSEVKPEVKPEAKEATSHIELIKRYVEETGEKVEKGELGKVKKRYPEEWVKIEKAEAHKKELWDKLPESFRYNRGINEYTTEELEAKVAEQAKVVAVSDVRKLTNSSGKDIDIKVGMHVKVNDSTTGTVEGFEAGIVLFKTDPINEAERAGKARPIQKINDSNVFDIIETPATKEEKLKKVSEKVKAETPGMLKKSDKVNDVTLGTLVKHATEDPAKALEHAADATVSKAKLIEGLKNKGLKAMGEAKSKEDRAEIKRNLEETLRGIEKGKPWDITKQERRWVVDSKTKDVLASAIGKQDKVDLPVPLDRKIIDIHTHPSEEMPSDYDWGRLGWSDVTEMRVVTPGGKVYGFKKPSGFKLNPRQLRERHNAIENKIFESGRSEKMSVNEILEAINAQLVKETGVIFETKSLKEYKGEMWAEETLRGIEEGEKKQDKYPAAGKKVDGRVVRKDVPNIASIEATLDEWTELPGIREISMSEIEITNPKELFYAADDMRSVRMLAKKIKETDEISPLIVVQDADGLYILEGAHRLGALHELKAKSFPALVIKDLESLEKFEAKKSKEPVAEAPAKEPWETSDLAEKPDIPNSYVAARKQPDGTYKFLFTGTRNEVFPGEKFRSAREARSFFVAQKIKAKEAAKKKEFTGDRIEKEPISETKSRLLENIKSEKGSSELINDLSRLGADTIKRGHKSFKSFSVEMKAILGNAWAKVKHLIRRAYSDAKRILKDERGMVGVDIGKPAVELGKKEHPTLTLGAQKLLGELEELKKEQKPSPPIPPEEVGTPAGKGTKVYNDLAAKLRTRTVDRLYPLMHKLDKGLDITDPDAQAYIQGRMDTSAPTVVATFLQHGKLKWLENAPLVETKDEGFLPLTEKHGTNEKKVDSYDTVTQTFLKDKIGYKPKSIRDIDRYLFWKIATRAEKLMGEDREHLFTKDDIALLKEIGGKDWKNTDLNKEYVAFNKNVLDFAQEIGLIDPVMRKVWEHDEYIPFYRILEDELLGEEFLRAPSKSRKFIDSQIKKLVGGTDKLGDPFENILRNWSHLIAESIRNRSRTTAFKYMQKLGYATPSKPPKYIGKPEKEAILSYMENGKRKNFKVHDLELFNALSGANVQKFDGILMNMFGTSKRMLTYGATFGPAFRVANFMRDTLQTAMVNKSFIPVWDSMQGLYKAYTESPDAIAMMAGGGGFSLGYVRGDDPKAMARHVRKIVRKAHKKGFTLSPLSLLEWWEKIGSASENAARVQLYANLRKKGASHLVAGYKARDILDFSLSGDAQITQLMVRTMPFLGARMQGLYKMGRAYGENPGTFMLKGAILAGLSLAWWTGVKEDDRYKELEDWEKWTYRHFWIGDMHFRLPRAFEVDAIFSSSVESIADTLSGNEEGKHIMHFIGQTMRDTFALDVPQLVRPLYEQAKNEIGFTGRPIISESMKRVKPGEQSQPWTSESLQVLGEKLNVSPMRAEALVRGYLATLGMFILGATDVLSQWAFDFPTPPKKRVDDYPLIGRFARETPPRHTKYMTRFYKMTREMDVLVGTINHYKKTGNVEKAVELARVSRDTLQYKKGVNRIRRKIGLINGRIKIIHYQKDLTPEQKKTKINKLLDYRNKILENAYNVMLKKEVSP